MVVVVYAVVVVIVCVKFECVCATIFCERCSCKLHILSCILNLLSWRGVGTGMFARFFCMLHIDRNVSKRSDGKNTSTQSSFVLQFALQQCLLLAAIRDDADDDDDDCMYENYVRRIKRRPAPEHKLKSGRSFVRLTSKPRVCFLVRFAFALRVSYFCDPIPTGALLPPA